MLSLELTKRGIGRAAQSQNRNRSVAAFSPVRMWFSMHIPLLPSKFAGMRYAGIPRYNLRSVD
jgi:hypothetical protein